MKTPEEVRPILLTRLAVSVTVFDAMSWFPAAPRWVVPQILEDLVIEGVLETNGITYRRK